MIAIVNNVLSMPGEMNVIVNNVLSMPGQMNVIVNNVLSMPGQMNVIVRPNPAAHPCSLARMLPRYFKSVPCFILFVCPRD
jgi:hypothetical protein